MGRKDFPTDGVEDYCRFLGVALEAKGCRVEIVRMEWESSGWIRAFIHLWQESRKWKGKVVLAQYTALMWSRRGFPLAFPIVLLTLKARGLPLKVVFHDIAPCHGERLIDRIRRACQRWVFRKAYAWTQACVVTVPIEKVAWLPQPATRARHIPVGPNIPAIPVSDRSSRNGDAPRTIVVFVVTDGGDISMEVSEITQAALAAARHLPRVRLVTLGRGSLESEPEFRKALEGSSVEYHALGVLPAEEVSRVFSEGDASIFVRGCVSTQRGSAIASIACALPLVAYSDPCLPFPLSEAGVVGVLYRDREQLATEVVKVLTDRELWGRLRDRSQRAYQRHFSWEAVAARYIEMFNHA